MHCYSHAGTRRSLRSLFAWAARPCLQSSARHFVGRIECTAHNNVTLQSTWDIGYAQKLAGVGLQDFLRNSNKRVQSGVVSAFFHIVLLLAN
jgi:hypothetical protein